MVLGPLATGATQQTQSYGLAHGFASRGDAELGVDVAGVGPHSVHRHAELSRDGGSAQVAVEQPQDVELTLAERVDEKLSLPSGCAAGRLGGLRRLLLPGGEHGTP